MNFYEWMQSALLEARHHVDLPLCSSRRHLLSDAFGDGHKRVFEALRLCVEFHNR